MAADDRVVILGQDVASRGGLFGATAGLAENFGQRRVLDCPAGISGLVGTGIGLALGGMLPIVEIQLADVIHGAFDQLISEAARYHYRSNGEFSVPLVVRVPWGAGVHGGLYHSQAIEVFFAHVPGLKVVVPSTPADAAGLLRSALADPDPVLILEHKKTYRLVDGPVPADWEAPIGVAELARRGDDLTLITHRPPPPLAAQAADVLAGRAHAQVLLL